MRYKEDFSFDLRGSMPKKSSHRSGRPRSRRPSSSPRATEIQDPQLDHEYDQPISPGEPLAKNHPKRRFFEFQSSPDALLSAADLQRATAKATGIAAERIETVWLLRKSIDARKGKVRLALRVGLQMRDPGSGLSLGPGTGPGTGPDLGSAEDLDTDSSPKPSPTPSETPSGAPSDAPVGSIEPESLQPADPPQLRGEAPVIIVGAGPTGMFCALRLAELGIRCRLFERGYDVRKRRKDLAALQREGILNPESNYCFGEGGAGTYSDGKLYTRSVKRGPVRWVLQSMVRHGAPADILVNARPHVGTNRLPKVITSLREWLLAAGQEIYFGQRVDDLQLTTDRRFAGVTLADRSQVEGKFLVLAAGHSAPDVLRMLDRQGVQMQPKDFAVGVRIEHPQDLIDKNQYGTWAGHPVLGAASYRLVESALDRSIHSFCMCPGGVIVPSSTLPGHQVTNGMSPYQRRGQRANSGFVVQVRAEHLQAAGFDPQDLWSGLNYIEALERRAFEVGQGDYVAPGQRLCDLVEGKASRELGASSYHRGVLPCHLGEVLRELYDPIAQALAQIQQKIPDFLHPEAMALAAESRTSSPVQIPRNRESLESLGMTGLYACGEGAGFAGGIVSAALDGKRVAEAIAQRVLNA